MNLLQRSVLALAAAVCCASGLSAEKYHVYFDNSYNWDVRVWAWNDQVSSLCSNTSWPGDPMTGKDGLLYWECPSDDQAPTMIIFSNNGGEKAGGGDLKFVNGATYKPDGSYSTGGNDDPTPNPNPDPVEPDPTPGPTPTPSINLITDYYSVNPDGRVGSYRTINMSFTNQKAEGALSHWTADDLIAQGVARDVAQAMKGNHERPVVDSYAIYAAYDEQYLYLGAQFVYTVWDLYGEGKQPGESKPYNMDGRMMWAFDLHENQHFDGYIDGTKAIWNDNNQPGAKFANGVDAVWIGSTKPGVGTPGFFIPTPQGHASYDAAYCKSISGNYYGYQDGLLPHIDKIWGQKEFNFNPTVLTGNDGFADLRGESPESGHTFYEWRLPLSVLGITADHIRNKGIGVMYIDVYGCSPVGGTPYDASYFDNVKDSYSMDPSSSAEKEDEDIITVAPARIGRLLQGNSSAECLIAPAADEAAPEYFTLQGIRVSRPESGQLLIVRRGTKVSKELIR